MRERTTWNREVIANQSKIAEDPRAMNQDHLQQQPAADAYVIGGPSEFGEDVHPSSEWKSEYSGGDTKRNEIGMPDMRGETFSHPEKTASDEATVMKRADLCVRVARVMLKGAAESVIEDQALALMHLPPTDLIETHNRLAGVVAAQEDEKKEGEEQEKKEQQSQDKEAGQMPPALKDYMEGKDKGDDKKDDDKKEDKEASIKLLSNAVLAAQAGDSKALQAAIQEMVAQQVKGYAIADQQQQQMAQQQDQQQMQQAQEQQQQQQMAQQQQMQQMSQQIQDMVAQQVQQQMAQQQQMQQQADIPPSIAQQQLQQQGCGGPMMSDDQLLDQMVQAELSGPQMMAAAESDIQIDGSQMDVGETVLGSEDAILAQLFSDSNEVRLAAHAQELTTGVNPLMHTPPAGALGAPANVRTASAAQPRTVQAGVSRLGGGVASGSNAGGGEIDKLANLWRSAPDVSSTFNQ